MKRKDFLKEISLLSADELKVKSTQLAEELMKLRFKKASSQLETSHRIKLARRSRARVSTLLTRTQQSSGTK